jgi:hypothetical protein
MMTSYKGAAHVEHSVFFFKIRISLVMKKTGLHTFRRFQSFLECQIIMKLFIFLKRKQAVLFPLRSMEGMLI